MSDIAKLGSKYATLKRLWRCFTNRLVDVLAAAVATVIAGYLGFIAVDHWGNQDPSPQPEPGQDQKFQNVKLRRNLEELREINRSISHILAKLAEERQPSIYVTGTATNGSFALQPTIPQSTIPKPNQVVETTNVSTIQPINLKAMRITSTTPVYYRRAYGGFGHKLYRCTASVDFGTGVKEADELVDSVEYVLGNNGSVKFDGYSDMAIDKINRAFYLSVVLRFREPVTFNDGPTNRVHLSVEIRVP